METAFRFLPRLMRVRAGRSLRAALAALAALAGLMGPSMPAWAIDEAGLQAFVEREARHQAGPGLTRIEIRFGAIDPQQLLASCPRPEPFLPVGSRFWGHSRVGLRCGPGPGPVVLVTVNVRLWGQALIANRPLAAMQRVALEDLRAGEAEWTREPMGVITDPRQIGEQVLTRPVPSGQAIAVGSLREAPAVNQGEPVRLVASGNGFSVSTEAVAVGSASAGQPVRVRTESGRVITGTARPGRVVEVEY